MSFYTYKTEVFSEFEENCFFKGIPWLVPCLGWLGVDVNLEQKFHFYEKLWFDPSPPLEPQKMWKLELFIDQFCWPILRKSWFFFFILRPKIKVFVGRGKIAKNFLNKLLLLFIKKLTFLFNISVKGKGGGATRLSGHVHLECKCVFLDCCPKVGPAPNL